MPTFKMPKSSTGLLLFLEQASATGKQDRDLGRPLLDEIVLNEIDDFVAEWGPQVRQLDRILAARSKEVRESREAIVVLGTYVRDAWVVEKRRITREELPAEVHRFYGMDLSGTIPRTGSRQQWMEWAQRIVDGDVDAVAAGYEPIANPSAAQVAEKLTQAKAEVQDVAMTDREYSQAQKAVASGRARAEELTYEIMDQLRFNLRREEAANRRRVMRSYGATFAYADGEQVDAEDAAPEPEGGEG